MRIKLSSKMIHLPKRRNCTSVDIVRTKVCNILMFNLDQILKFKVVDISEKSQIVHMENQNCDPIQIVGQNIENCILNF